MLLKQILPITNMNPHIPSIIDLLQRIEQLEKRIEYLEDENVGMTNELYELQNRLDILNDPKYEHLSDFTLGE
jgi:regulator of replication initiation timing